MLRRLTEYRVGIFMPHMLDEHTGEIQPLHDDVMQVESGLDVSFQTTREIENHIDRFFRGIVLACRRIKTHGRVRNGSGRATWGDKAR